MTEPVFPFTRTTLAAALALSAGVAQAQSSPPAAPDAPSNTAPTLVDTSGIATSIASGSSVMLPLPPAVARASDAENDALDWAFADEPGATRVRTVGGVAMFGGSAAAPRLSFFAADGFSGAVEVPLIAIETDTPEALVSASMLTVTVTVSADDAAPFVDAASEPDDELAPEPEDELAPGPDDELAPELVDELAPGLDNELAPEPEDELAPGPDDEPAPEPEDELAPELGDELAPEPGDELALEPGEPSALEPDGELVPAPEDDALAPEPDGELAPGPNDLPESEDEPAASEVDDDATEAPGPEAQSGEGDASSPVLVAEPADSDEPGESVPPPLEPDAGDPADVVDTPEAVEDAAPQGEGDEGEVLGLRLIAVSDEAVALAWEALPGTLFTVQRDGIPIAGPDEARYVDADVVVGQTYVYTLMVTDATGRTFVAPERVRVTVSRSAPGPDVRSPIAPGEVLALRRDDGEVIVAWHPGGDDHGVAGYDLYRDGTYFKTVYATAYVDLDAPAGADTVYEVVAFDEARNYSPRSVASFVDDPFPAVQDRTGELSVTTDADGAFSFAPVNRSGLAIVLVADDAATSLWPSAAAGGATSGGFVTRASQVDVLVLPAFDKGEATGLTLGLTSDVNASSTLSFDPTDAVVSAEESVPEGE